jgi:hypothetical protein
VSWDEENLGDCINMCIGGRGNRGCSRRPDVKQFSVIETFGNAVATVDGETDEIMDDVLGGPLYSWNLMILLGLFNVGTGTSVEEDEEIVVCRDTWVAHTVTLEVQSILLFFKSGPDQGTQMSTLDVLLDSGPPVAAGNDAGHTANKPNNGFY